MRLNSVKFSLILGCYAALTACEPSASKQDQALTDVRILAADEMNGRKTGSQGNADARAYIIERYNKLGLKPLSDNFVHEFEAKIGSRFIKDAPKENLKAYNIIGTIPGKSDQTILVSAHYDHIGVHEGNIYNGADDNASGVAGMLAIAEHFKENPPQHTFIFTAFDAEEFGLQGARNFVSQPEFADLNIVLNINLDMIGFNTDDTIYIAGTFHTPELLPLVTELAEKAPITIKVGHDQPDSELDDWTLASDHGPFHKQGLPFLYMGVEDHPHYHSHTDTYENLTKEFFIKSAETVVLLASLVDAKFSSGSK